MTTELTVRPGDTDATSKTAHYFAYGSNLNEKDLQEWCHHNRVARTPFERPGRAARLPDWELCFNYRSQSRKGGALNLRRRKGQLVEGILFEVDESGWRILDQKEGAPKYYERVPVHVVDDNGVVVEAFTYTVVPERCRDYTPPTSKYVEVVGDGLENFELDTEQLEAAAKDAPVPFALDAVFVYGTLMRGEKHFAALKAVAEFECLLLATTCGRMLDLDAFPAVAHDATNQVHGEFMRVRNPSQVLDHLDAIEGFTGYHADSLFHRLPITVDAGDGRRRPAWAYVLPDSGQDQSAIPSGSWRRHHRRSNSFMRGLFDMHCAHREVEITDALASRVPFSIGAEHEEVVQELTPLYERFLDGTVSERRLARITGKWTCIPS